MRGQTREGRVHTRGSAGLEKAPTQTRQFEGQLSVGCSIPPGCTTYPRLSAAIPENRQNRSVLNSADLRAMCTPKRSFPLRRTCKHWAGALPEYWACRRGNPSQFARSLGVSNKSTPRAPSGANPGKRLVRPVSPSVCVRNIPLNCLRGFSNKRNGLVLRYNRRAAELWGRSPKLGDPNERFCGSYRMFRPDGSPLAHHQCPMADVLRTGVSVREQEVHIERPNGSRGIAPLTSSQSGIAMETLSAPSTASRI
jgi:hypothetical protein